MSYDRKSRCTTALRPSTSKVNGENGNSCPQPILLQRPQTSRVANVECPCCRRFYSDYSIEFHLKVCSPRKAEEERRKKELEEHLERLSRKPCRPPGHPCYICGGRYTNSSWEYHEARCTERWHTWNELLPKDLKHHEGIFKPDTSEETITAVWEKERTAGKPEFTKLDALDKILLDASYVNSLPE
nr:zinc finger protein 474 [Hymenolepis microstoma]